MATLQNTTINSTGFLTIPVGNTTQRPGSPVNGMLRFNTDTGQIEVYNSGATAWGSITGPTISQIQITDSGYNVLDDTAVNTSGGYIKITGTGFGAGAVVVIGGVNATSTTVVNSTTLNVQVPAQVAGTYTVYVVNTNGGTAIGVNGLTYSALPNWVTGSTLPNGQTGTPISIQLNATDATSYALAPANTLPTGLTLTSGGLLSGTVTIGSETTYSFTIIATDAQLQDSPRAFTITISVGDPYFYLTTLLLAGNGTNNGTNNTFTDSSTNALAITRYGNTTQGTFSPFSQTGWSNLFDGTGDFLSVPANNAFSYGTGDFTYEMWVYLTSYGNTGSYSFLCGAGGSGQADQWNLNNTNNGRFIYYDGVNSVISSDNDAGKIALYTWTHIVVCRSGSTLRLFKNGVEVGSMSSTANITIGASNTFYIGNRSGGGESPQQALFGYISNLRVVKGTAVYTSNFTPPIAPLTAISGTSLLTCQSNRFLDNSTNNFTISRGGDVSVQPFEPFAPGSSYSAGTVGGSSYYDGTADYLTVADNAGLDIGLSSTPFTLEFWVWFNNLSSSQTTYARGGGTGGWDGSAGWQWTNFYYSADGSFYNQFWNGSSRTDFAFNFNSAGGKPMQWNHIAYSYNGSNYSCFVNGNRAATITASFGKPTNSNKTSIGAATGVVSGETNVLNGYISGLRIVKGTAVYNPTLSTLTVPTAPPTAVANTSLLLNFTNGQILDSTSKNILETLGDAKISTAQSKWGGSSMYFDGTTDKLSIPFTNSFLELGINVEKCTLEAWIYPTNTMASTGQIISKGGGTASWSTTNGAQYQLSISSSAITWGFNSSGSAISVSGGTVTLNTWQHVAVTYDGTTTKVFLNGVQQGTSTSSYTAPTTRNLQYIGMTQSGGFTQDYYGYINDLRVTKGYARYTTNFTPPSSAFPTQ